MSSIREVAKLAGVSPATVSRVMNGTAFLDACKEYGVHDDYIQIVDGLTGHTIIQIDKNAQNSILLFGGANQKLTRKYVDEVLSQFTSDDILLLQNKVNLLPYIVDRAYEKEMKITLNAFTPFWFVLDDCTLSL